MVQLASHVPHDHANLHVARVGDVLSDGVGKQTTTRPSRQISRVVTVAAYRLQPC